MRTPNIVILVVQDHGTQSGGFPEPRVPTRSPERGRMESRKTRGGVSAQAQVPRSAATLPDLARSGCLVTAAFRRAWMNLKPSFACYPSSSLEGRLASGLTFSQDRAEKGTCRNPGYGPVLLRIYSARVGSVVNQQGAVEDFTNPVHKAVQAGNEAFEQC